jgi:plastocyanin
MLPIVLTLLPFAYAATHVVEVGKGGSVFSPDTVTAAVGDQVQFKFASQGHAVTASTFTSPCAPADSSTFFSGHGEVVRLLS